MLGLAALPALPGHNQALALDGQRTLAQYVHTAWGAVEGYSGGTIYAMANRGMVTFGWAQSAAWFASMVPSSP